MFPFKPLSEYSLDDLQRLITEQVSEGDRIEFKGKLPAKGNNPDPWVSGENRIGDRARDKILTELIALANTHGGYLFLGIEESSEKPPRASFIAGIPRCVELVERISQMADALIEPRLPQFSLKPILTGEDGEGVVLLHTLRSTLAPHRFTPNNESYFRRNERCERMTMQEIQHLSRQVHRQAWEGLWAATFSVPGSDKNGGIVVFDEGRIFGGDSQFYYEGGYDIVEEEIYAEIRVTHYHGGMDTAFGDHARNFMVQIRAQRHGDVIEGKLFRTGFEHTPAIRLVRKASLP
ncbi:MAG: putative DNA binding domain-containing protein [Alphaproteobacteria bacterium]|nr:putative DNA binding domain-containing protein [Alphaproteobacteria bacterium]